MSGYSSTVNGKKGGRPIYSVNTAIKIPDIDCVILTTSQYETLLERYGYNLLIKALVILENWLKNSHDGLKYKGKNNYGHFRADGWVINTAKKEMEL